MAIIGMHALLYTSEPERLRSILRDVFKFPHVDAGDGWLIFALPPSEVGVHPADGPTHDSGVRHQLTFMCDDIAATLRDLRAKGIDVDDDPDDEGWGVTAMMRPVTDVEVRLYEPRHPIAIRASIQK